MLNSLWLPIMVLALLTIFSSCQKEPIASFTVSSTSVNVDEIVSFSNTSIDAYRYEWDFGDGSTATYSSPKHTYTIAGTYTVTLTAFSKNGKKSGNATESITVSGSQNQTGSFTDTRDGQTYKTVKIGSQWWMAENLNYNTGNSWCYDNNSSNCNTYGRLYDSNTALIVAPAGWHIPTDAEWKTLEMYLGMSQSQTNATGWRGTDQGDQLKTFAHCNGGTNCATSGFKGLMGGFRTIFGDFYGMGTDSGYRYGTSAGLRYLDANQSGIYYGVGNVDAGYSVRCIKD